MRYRKQITLLIILMLCVGATVNFLFSTKAISSEKTNNLLATVKASLNSSTEMRNPTENVKRSCDIPDKVAYEIFLRTIGEHNARSVLERAGFDDKAVEVIVNEAKALNSTLEQSDKQARELKETKDKSAAQTKNESQRLRKLKDEIVVRQIGYLQRELQADDWLKFQNFINSEVKRNIQKVSIDNLKQTKTAVTNAKQSEGVIDETKNRVAQSGGGNVYLYSTTWKSDSKVFGAGTVLEQYESKTSYRLTITVASPSGRVKTTNSAWSYAPVTYRTGFPIGLEDGLYNVQATFESRQGYHDENGNFVGRDSSIKLTTSTSSEMVAPIVNVESVTPATLSLRGNESGEFVANVSVTNDVPLQTVVVVEIFETSSPQFTYTVAPTSRTKSFTVTQPGTSVSVDFVVQISTNTSQGAGTSVTNKIRVLSATPPQGSPAVTAGTNAPTATLTYSGPSGTGGGCESELTTSGEKSIAKISLENCNPTPDPCEATHGPGWFMDTSNGFCLPPECRTCFELGGTFCSQSGICWTPIVIDMDGNGFNLTNASSGVMYKPDSISPPIRTAWTSAYSDDAFLVLDRNGNGQIDDGTELFGCATPQPDVPAGALKNGFLALAVYDKIENGGNGDGQIDARDAVFARLKLWQDRNHNGISEADELQNLSASTIREIELRYRESRRTDEYGNKFKYRAKVRDARGAQVGRWAWDVFFVSSR